MLGQDVKVIFLIIDYIYFFHKFYYKSNKGPVVHNSLSLGYLRRTDTGCLSDGDKLKQFSTVVVGLF